MCNMLHRKNNFKRITRTGEAWKLFTIRPTMKEPTALIGNANGYKKSTDGWISWSHKVAHSGYLSTANKRDMGFCAFGTEAEALDTLNGLITNRMSRFYGRNTEVVCRKVLYTNGLGSCESTELDGKPRRFVFFKNFTFIK